MARSPRTPPKNPSWYCKPDDEAYLTACKHSPKECLDIALGLLPAEAGLRIVSYWWERGYDVMSHPGMSSALTPSV